MRRGDHSSQQGGADSVNLQAGRDIVLSSESSRAEVREVVLSVFYENFMELRGAAEDVAIGRAEKITNEFLDKLQLEAPQRVSSFGEPDMQRAMYSAQREYACSGEEDLGQVLVDLLVDRAKEDDRSLKTLALNEAINAAPKLTDGQRRAIAAVFLLRYTRYAGTLNVDGYYQGFIETNLLPLASSLPSKQIEYQHVEYVGAGTISMGEVPFADALRNSAEGLFTQGIPPETLPEELQGEPFRSLLFTECLRNEGNVQLRLTSKQGIDELMQQLEAFKRQPENDIVLPTREVLLAQADAGVMGTDEVASEVVARVPAMAVLREVWDGSPLKNLTLTSVGIAIGHAYWRRITGGTADLGIWL